MVMNLIAAMLHQKISSTTQQARSNILILFGRELRTNQVKPTSKIGVTIRFTERLSIGFSRTVVGNTAVFLIVGIVLSILHQNIDHFIPVAYFTGQ
ncbi:hypothetical protein D3C85_1625660 [compost metagenome]